MSVRNGKSVLEKLQKHAGPARSLAPSFPQSLLPPSNPSALPPGAQTGDVRSYILDEAKDKSQIEIDIKQWTW